MTPVMAIESALPAGAGAARAALYDGRIFMLEATAASRALTDDAWTLLRDAFPEADDPRDAATHVDPAEHFARIGAIRRQLFCEPHFHQRVFDVVAACGFDPGRVAFDPIRLRVVGHRGHENPRAAAVYYPHRDTWYAHSQAAVAWWVSLHDIDPPESFVFYPERFSQPVANDSETFSYGRWVADGWDLKIGWQRRDAGLTAHYPSVVGEPDAGPSLGFASQRGQNLLFAAAHFHRTLEQSSGRTRFSLDFRVVDLDDHDADRGAPNADNRSRGDATVDYVRPEPLR